MNHNDLINLLLCIGIMLLTGRLFGEFFRKLKMPLVVGELVAGILLGPSLLGKFFIFDFADCLDVFQPLFLFGCWKMWMFKTDRNAVQGNTNVNSIGLRAQGAVAEK